MKEIARRIGPMLWVWVTVVAATFFSVALFWNQGRQRRVFEHFTGQQASVHQAQRDLARGYLHISLSSLPRSPFDRAQGLALLDQAGKSLERALEIRRQFASSRVPASADDASSHLTAYVKAMESFRATLAAEPVSRTSDPARQAELRISFFALERLADAADLRIRQELTRTMRTYNRFYALVLWASGFLLLVICIAVYAAGRARKQAEAELRTSEEIHRLIVDNSGDAILFTHPDGSIYSANPAACRMFGRDEEEICRIGREGVIDVNDLRLASALEERRRTGAFKGELTMRRNDGTKFLAEISSTMFRDSRGVERASMIIRDVTERKRAEKERRQSDERFRIAQEMSPDGFTILRPVRDTQNRVIDFTWVYENDAIARLNGTDPQKVVGQRLLELFPGHRDTQFMKVYQQVAESGESIVFEEGYSGESMQKQVWFRIVVVPMVEDIAVLANDITDRKRAEEKMAEQLHELQRWHNVMLDREDRVIELKREVNELLARAGQPPRYPSAVEKDE